MRRRQWFIFRTTRATIYLFSSTHTDCKVRIDQSVPFSEWLQIFTTCSNQAGWMMCRRPLSNSACSRAYSSSLLSSSSSSSAAASAFLVGFFFFLRFFFLSDVGLPSGCSRILRTSSSVIVLSVLNLERSGVGGAARRVSPFLVMAMRRSVGEH